MPAASILIKPASAACNIACRYCFYHDIACARERGVRPVMSEATLENLTRAAMAYAEGQVTFAWQGGEPMLAGLPFFRRAVELQRELARPGLRVENTIQTNGTLIDDDWAAFFAERGFLVGVSIDGPRRVNDAARVGRGGEGTFQRVMRGVGALRRHGVDFNVLTVVTSASAECPAEVYRFLTGQGFGWLQFIPCMDDRPGEGNPWAVESRAYGAFLADVFDLWFADFCHGTAPDIRMFSNLAQMAAGFAPEECGMCGRCTTYFAVESDGSVYPCDFYTTDDWLLGNVNEMGAGDAGEGAAGAGGAGSGRVGVAGEGEGAVGEGSAVRRAASGRADVPGEGTTGDGFGANARPVSVQSGDAVDARREGPDRAGASDEGAAADEGTVGNARLAGVREGAAAGDGSGRAVSGRAIGANGLSGFQTLYDGPRSQAFMAASVQKPPECLLCPWYRLCRGGCRRWRDLGRLAPARADGSAPAGLGLNYLCAGYKLFFERCAPRIAQLGRVVQRNVALGLV